MGELPTVFHASLLHHSLIFLTTLALSPPLSPFDVAPFSLFQGNSLAVGQAGQSCGGIQENGVASEESRHLSQGPAGTTALELLDHAVHTVTHRGRSVLF